jgi:phosphoglycolate phosphatase
VKKNAIHDINMDIEKPTIILLDMDGTLVRHRNKFILNMLERVDDFIVRTGRLFRIFRLRLRRNKNIPRFFLPGDDSGQLSAKRKTMLVHKTLHKMRRKDVNQIVRISSGARKFLEKAQEYDIPMGLVSNGLGRGYGRDILKSFQLERFFNVAIFREDYAFAKPYPDPLLRALDGIGRPLRSDDVIWYLGDRNKDVKAAMAAHYYLSSREDKVKKVVPFAFDLFSSAFFEAIKQGLPQHHIIGSFREYTVLLEAMHASVTPDLQHDQAQTEVNVIKITKKT